MDGTSILSDLADRNALRQAHGLPLLDVEVEYGRLIMIERQREYHLACQEHVAEFEAIRRQVKEEHGPRSYDTMFGRWAVGYKARARFTAYMSERYGIHPPRRSG